MINIYVAQPLFTLSLAKFCIIKEAKVLKCHENTRIKCFREISSWLQNDCHQSAKLLPENQDATHLSSENAHAVNENTLEIYEDISLFQVDEE